MPCSDNRIQIIGSTESIFFDLMWALFFETSRSHVSLKVILLFQQYFGKTTKCFDTLRNLNRWNNKISFSWNVSSKHFVVLPKYCWNKSITFKLTWLLLVSKNNAHIKGICTWAKKHLKVLYYLKYFNPFHIENFNGQSC